MCAHWLMQAQNIASFASEKKSVQKIPIRSDTDARKIPIISVNTDTDINIGRSLLMLRKWFPSVQVKLKATSNQACFSSVEI